MWRRLIAIALTAAGCLACCGCGQSAHVKAQQQQIAYQDQLGHINAVFAHPTTDPRRMEALLARAVAQYAALRPPPALRTLNTQLIAALRGELRAFQDGFAANRDAARIHAAEALDARSRAAAAKVLKRIAAIVGACRTDAANC